MPDVTDSDDPSPAVEHAVAVLYAGAPEDFLPTRTELSARARADGDASAAKAIAALRKPTVAAAVVNRYVQANPDGVDRLLDIGARLREAHEALDAALLRDLSAERRALVAELTAAAFELSGIGSPSARQRDEVTNTFDAAVADPEIAGRLGRLTRSESWSGFGVAPLTGPALTLLRGGRDAATPPRKAAAKKAAPASRGTVRAPEPPATPRPSAAETRKARRTLERARAAFDEADTALQEAEQAERSASERIREISAQLSDLQRELEQRKQDRDRSRRAVKVARGKRREARSALDRAERQADS